MKTKIRGVVSFFLCWLLFLATFLPMNASAAQSQTMAGAYVILSGSCVQNETVPNILNTTTSVRINPDHAELVVELAILDGINPARAVEVSGGYNITSFDYDHPLYEAIDYWAEYVYCEHNVLNGSSEDAYYCREEFALVWD